MERVSAEVETAAVREQVATSRRAPLALSPDVFRSAGHALVDRLAEFLAELPQGRVTAALEPAELRRLLGADAPLPDGGSEPGPLLLETTELLLRASLFNGHPRFFGYVTSSPAHIGILGEMLAAAVNPNCGAWILSPAATEIEGQTIRWIAELIGYPTDCGGLLVSGGNMANFVGVLAARASLSDRNVREAGVGGQGNGHLRLYASPETHTWLQKAADLFGLGTDAIHWIPTDGGGKLNVERLVAAVRADREKGDAPFLVAATAGTVSTGVVDPIREISAACRELGLWLHVDGAYGGLAAAVRGLDADLDALALADSVAVDPHKWLYAPLEAGCALVRDPERLRAAFSYHPPYYHFDEELTNYFDLGPQNSRGFRALKVWLALRQVGASGYRRMIGDDIRLAERLLDNVQRHPELEGTGQALSIVTFRYLPDHLRHLEQTAEGRAEVDAMNERLLDRMQGSGEAFVSHAVISGRFHLRACIVNFNTREEDVDALPEIVVRIGRSCEPAEPRGGR